MSHPLSSGVPPCPPYLSAPTAPATLHAPACPPASAPAYDPYDFAYSVPRPDEFVDPDERLPDEDHPPVDPLAPSLSLDSYRSEYRRMFEYVCGLFPQAVGVPPVELPPRARFESFFAPLPQSLSPLAFNWFERVRQALMDADSRLAAWVVAGRSDRSFLPARHSTYAVRSPLAVRFLLTTLCSRIMIVPCVLPCRWVLPFGILCPWRHPSALKI